MPRRLVIYDDDMVQAQALLGQVSELACSAQLESQVLCELERLRALLLADEVDVLLMDIRIEGSNTNGIELVRRCLPPQSPTQVIFVTGFDTYHASAYRASHIGFLMKPVRPDELEEALTKALTNLESFAERPFLVRTPTGGRVIQPRYLRYVEIIHRRLLFHVGDEVVETMTKVRLDDIVAQLPVRFIRCHKSYVVNMGFVDELDRTGMTLTTGEHVPVSQKRRPQVRDEFFDYIGRSLAEHMGGVGE